MKEIVLSVAIIAGFSAARATTYFSSGRGEPAIGLNPGHAQRDPILIGDRGGLMLMAPGTYTASSWSISGELRLPVPGNYVLVATNGSIALNSGTKITGPAGTGTAAQLIFAHAGQFIMAAPEIDKNVTIVRGQPVPSESPPLVNVSTRTTLAAGQTHTSGFVVGGTIKRQVLVRAVGPTLASFGVANALATPVLTVANAQGVVGTNSGWGGNGQVSFASLLVGAFPLPSDSRDAALVLLLDPGSYNVQVAGGAGEVLVEIYYWDLSIRS